MALKWEVHVPAVADTFFWRESPQETSTSIFSDFQFFNHSNRKTQLENQLKSFFVFFFLRAAPKAYGGSQVRGRTRAIAAGLRHNHSNMGSKPHLQPVSQLTAKPDP